MRDFLFVYLGALVALGCMLLASFIPIRGVRNALSILALLAVAAHAGLIVILLGIGSSGGVADAAMRELFGRSFIFGSVILIWAFFLVVMPTGDANPAPKTDPTGGTRIK